jgi:hypothetical protein
MKKFALIIITATVTIATIGCEQFSTSYQRIDDSEFRMLKYIWEPADAAPGDTITLTAVFAGKREDLNNDLQWWVSFNVIRDLLGSTTVVDSMRLEPIAESRLVDFSPNTQAVEFKIPVPSDIVKKSASIPENWTDALPAQMKDALPKEFASMTKTQLVDMIELSAKNVNAVNPEFARALVPVLQFFTVPMRVFTKMHEPGRLPHTIVSTQYIRYNNRFKTAGIPVNNIPVVDKVVVYKVKGNDVESIDYKGGVTYDSTILDESGNTVIDVEDGYSYFLDALSNNIDTTVTMDGNRIPEKHRVYRQFQLDKKETAGIHHSKFMDINNFNGKVYMPKDRKITKFTFWLTVYDEAQNERLRPNGETLVERSGRLRYK